MKKITTLLAALTLLLAACGGASQISEDDLVAKTFSADAAAWISDGALLAPPSDQPADLVLSTSWSLVDGTLNQAILTGAQWHTGESPAVLFGIYDPETVSRADGSTIFAAQAGTQSGLPTTIYFSDLATSVENSMLAACARGESLEGVTAGADMSRGFTYTQSDGKVIETFFPHETFSGKTFGSLNIPFVARRGLASDGDAFAYYVDYCVPLNGRVLVVQTVQGVSQYLAFLAADTRPRAFPDVTALQSAIDNFFAIDLTAVGADGVLAASYAQEIFRLLPYDPELDRFIGDTPLLIDVDAE